MGFRVFVAVPTDIRDWTRFLRNAVFEFLKIEDGTNRYMGVATLVAGTVTVANTKVQTNSRIFLSGQDSSGTHGELTVSARTAGTSFTITSTNAADTRQVSWLMIEPS
jgi:hypothetical protein